jgi:hypothetical protein
MFYLSHLNASSVLDSSKYLIVAFVNGFDLIRGMGASLGGKAEKE